MLVDSHATPKLNTTFTESLHFLEKNLIAQHASIESWFDTQWQINAATCLWFC